MSYNQSRARVIFSSPRHVLSTHYASPRCFFDIFSASSPSRVTLFQTRPIKKIRVKNFQLLKLLSTPICAHNAGGQTFPCPPAVILHPCWRPISPLPAQRSSSTPVCGQLHPSPRLLVSQGESREGEREDGRQGVAVWGMGRCGGVWQGRGWWVGCDWWGWEAVVGG